jgi:uncharacterized protein with GYD domain
VRVIVQPRWKEEGMTRYLFKVSYSQSGLQGVLREGAEHRASFIATMAADVGGSLSSFDFAFGDTDAYVICEFPDDETAAAVAVAVASSGTGSIETVKLLTPAQVDRAREIHTTYRPPGQ